MNEQQPQRRQSPEAARERRRLRLRRHGRRAFIRSVYSLPSLATLGNAICGFAAIYVATLLPSPHTNDAWTNWFAEHRFAAGACLVFFSMFFDAIDGRLARFTRHTTDFGGQLDSLADMVSFGVAPAVLALQLFKSQIEAAGIDLPVALSRGIWAIGALYMSCAAIRLARFNVSNEHGEQHHFSFLGLPSPGAAGAVVSLVLLHQNLLEELPWAASICLAVLPLAVMVDGLLMVSTIRYAHVVNRYLRGRKSVPRLILMVVAALLVVIKPTWTLAAALQMYSLGGPTSWLLTRFRRRSEGAAPATQV